MQAQSLLSSTDPAHSYWQTPEELKRWTAANGSQMRFEPGDETPLLEDSHDLPT